MIGVGDVSHFTLIDKGVHVFTVFSLSINGRFLMLNIFSIPGFS